MASEDSRKCDGLLTIHRLRDLSYPNQAVHREMGSHVHQTDDLSKLRKVNTFCRYQWVHFEKRNDAV